MLHFDRATLWQASALVCAIAGVAMAVGALGLGLAGDAGPGPGFFPFWIGLLASIAGIGLLLVTRLRGVSKGVEAVVVLPAASRRGLLVVIGTAVLAVLLEPLGYRVTTLLLLLFVQMVLAVRPWWLVVVVATVGSFGTFHVFYFWLQMTLPVNSLGL